MTTYEAKLIKGLMWTHPKATEQAARRFARLFVRGVGLTGERAERGLALCKASLGVADRRRSMSRFGL